MRGLILTLLVCALGLGAAELPEQVLFNGQNLDGWSEIPFGGEGKVKVLADGTLEIGAGDHLSGLVYTNAPRRMDYEISLEGRRVEGSDFFCGLTFPVRTNSCTLVLGGWGGLVTGISSINGNDASENETSQTFDFKNDRWYRIRVRVTENRIEVWIDDQRVINLDTFEKRLGMRWGDIERCVPLGLATWQTRGQIRHLRVRAITPPPSEP